MTTDDGNESKVAAIKKRTIELSDIFWNQMCFNRPVFPGSHRTVEYSSGYLMRFGAGVNGWLW